MAVGNEGATFVLAFGIAVDIFNEEIFVKFVPFPNRELLILENDADILLLCGDFV